MGHKRTVAWYSTRILLILGLIPFLFLVQAVVSPPIFAGNPYMPPSPLQPLGDLVMAAGLGGMVFGYAWMIRIFRGPGDEPTSWRYRDW